MNDRVKGIIAIALGVIFTFLIVVTLNALGINTSGLSRYD
jgi:hypothetical protein